MSIAPETNRKVPGGFVADDGKDFAFTPENEELARSIIAKYPQGRQASAVLPLLHMAQKQHGGWLPRSVLD